MLSCPVAVLLGPLAVLFCPVAVLLVPLAVLSGAYVGGYLVIGALLVRAGSGPQHLERRSELDHLLAWRTQGFAAVDEPVGDILREVQRRYSVGLEIEPGLSMEDEMTVFYLRGTAAEQIIHDLCLSRGWRYRPTSNGFYVFSGQGISGTEGAQRKL